MPSFVDKKRLKRQISGLRSKRTGEAWENLFFSTCLRQRIACTRVPDGCKQIGQNRIIRVRTPFDWIVTYKGRTALLDTKATAHDSFLNSAIDTNQLRHLRNQEIHGAVAGYVIWFTTLDRVIFVPAHSLAIRTACRGSITPESAEVISLGSSHDLQLARIFDIPPQKTDT